MLGPHVAVDTAVDEKAGKGGDDTDQDKCHDQFYEDEAFGVFHDNRFILKSWIHIEKSIFGLL
jgi:hypothetical protein